MRTPYGHGAIFPDHASTRRRKKPLMKKIALAIAAMTCTAGALAQSSVTLFGVVDAGFTHLSSSTESVSGMSSGELSSSRLGFRGVEDLGSGLKAGFWLEGGLSVDTGGSSFRFDRRSTISLSGNWGELRLGRDKMTSYQNIESYDAFGDTGVGGIGASNLLGSASSSEGTAEGSNPKRLSNMVSYISPKVSGIQGQIQYSFGERGSFQANNDRGNGFGGRLSYGAGPLSLGLGYGEMSGGNDTLETTYKAVNLGASYNFGVVKPMVMWARESQGDRRINVYSIGASAPIGAAGELRMAYTMYDVKHADNADSSKLAIGYTHKLSKRTALYGMVARVDNDDMAKRGFATSSSSLASPTINNGDNATGYSVGIRHTF